MNRPAQVMFIAGLMVTPAGWRSKAALTDPTAPLLRVSADSKTALTGSTTTMSVSGCDFTVTYTWNGFHGKGLIASFGPYEHTSTLDFSIQLQNDEGQAGSGSATHVFHLVANAHSARTIIGRGSLEDGRKYSQIAGSTSASTNSVVSTCG